MNNNEILQSELTDLCAAARDLIQQGSYDKCRRMLYDSMSSNPDSPEPHNLLGLLLEAVGEHAAAMRHFRAAYALDPSYRPAQKNLDVFGMRTESGKGYYCMKDCEQKARTYVVVYNVRGFRRCEKRVS